MVGDDTNHCGDRSCLVSSLNMEEDIIMKLLSL